MIRVSAVIPTFRRPALLARCMGALASQDFDPSGFEVLIADDAASEETRSQVEARAASFPAAVRYLPVLGRHGPAAARNVGWRAARGEIVAFTDDDCIPDARWLSAGTAALTGGAVAAAGRVVVPLPRTPTDYERDAAGLERAEFVTANCFCRRDALEAIGGFDERFSAAWREDSDLQFSLLGRGGRIVRAEEAIVVHPVRPAPWGVSLRQQRKSLFDALLYKKHPAAYRLKVRPGPPADYYATVASLLLALAAGATGQLPTAMGAAGLWAALTGRFCARRLEGTSRAPAHVSEMIATSILIPPLSVFWRLYGALKFRVVFA